LAFEAEPAESLARRGAILLSEGRAQEAIPLLQRAIAGNPELAEAHNNLGSALMSLGDAQGAAEQYRAAIALQPLYSQAHTNLGAALRALGRLPEALASFERGADANPRDAKAFGDLAEILVEMGRSEEARDAYERAIAIAPWPAFFYGLGSIHTYTQSDPHLAALRRLSEDTGAFNADDRVYLHFALGKAFADAGDLERSFREFLSGNALQRSLEAYDEAGTLASYDAIRNTFTQPMMASLRGGGDPSAVPVFILGMPRSGSTLVEQILAAHPGVVAGGELDFIEASVGEVFGSSGASLTQQRLTVLGAHYLAKLRVVAPDALRITDKMPANVRFAGLISLALPNARIIYTRRNALDTCLSCFSILFKSLPHTNDLAEIGRYYRATERLMAHWEALLPEGTILDVHYEDVVADLETQARRIVAHAGLPWDDACLSFQDVQRPVQTASSAQVRKPLYGSSVGRWRPYAHLLRPLFDALEIEPPEA
jgi:tetratricopeptide (TPR) repeat protein